MKTWVLPGESQCHFKSFFLSPSHLTVFAIRLQDIHIFILNLVLRRKLWLNSEVFNDFNSSYST